MNEAMVVLDAGAVLGECPVWSVAEGALYWVDIESKTVNRFDPTTGRNAARLVPGKVGAIAIRGEGQLLAAVGTELGMLDFTTGDYEPWKPVEPGGTGNRLNDGRCDPVGRFWVGSMYDPTSARIRSGHLHRTDASGDQLTLLDDVGVANGLAFTPDGTTMYFADTFDRTVWAFDYDVDTGTPSNQRVFLDMGDLPGKPDGACVDEEGGYWLACVRGGALIRVLPSGVVERSIELPVSSPTMCAFGGTDLDVLYVTSIGMDDEPLSGSLLAIEPGVRGLPEPWFGIGGDAGSPA